MHHRAYKVPIFWLTVQKSSSSQTGGTKNQASFAAAHARGNRGVWYAASPSDPIHPTHLSRFPARFFGRGKTRT